jgi:hypothetical protein
MTLSSCVTRLPVQQSTRDVYCSFSPNTLQSNGDPMIEPASRLTHAPVKGFSVPPLHHAIDKLSAAYLGSQRLRRGFSVGQPQTHDELMALQRIEKLLAELGTMLSAMHGKTHSDPIRRVHLDDMPMNSLINSTAANDEPLNGHLAAP